MCPFVELCVGGSVRELKLVRNDEKSVELG